MKNLKTSISILLCANFQAHSSQIATVELVLNEHKFQSAKISLPGRVVLTHSDNRMVKPYSLNLEATFFEVYRYNEATDFGKSSDSSRVLKTFPIPVVYYHLSTSSSKGWVSGIRSLEPVMAVLSSEKSYHMQIRIGYHSTKLLDFKFLESI